MVSKDVGEFLSAAYGMEFERTGSSMITAVERGNLTVLAGAVVCCPDLSDKKLLFESDQET